MLSVATTNSFEGDLPASERGKYNPVWLILPQICFLSHLLIFILHHFIFHFWSFYFPVRFTSSLFDRALVILHGFNSFPYLIILGILVL